VGHSEYLCSTMNASGLGPISPMLGPNLRRSCSAHRKDAPASCLQLARHTRLASTESRTIPIVGGSAEPRRCLQRCCISREALEPSATPCRPDRHSGRSEPCTVRARTSALPRRRNGVGQRSTCRHGACAMPLLHPHPFREQDAGVATVAPRSAYPAVRCGLTSTKACQTRRMATDERDSFPEVSRLGCCEALSNVHASVRSNRKRRVLYFERSVGFHGPSRTGRRRSPLSGVQSRHRIESSRSTCDDRAELRGSAGCRDGLRG
jgi:hypothetical protein